MKDNHYKKYLALGCTLTRLAMGGKRPIDKDWTNAPGLTEAECKAHKDSGGNLGWVLGERHLVVDLDSHKGSRRVDGIGNYAKLCERLGMKVAKPSATTPSGGQHYYYEMPEGFVWQPGKLDGINMDGVEFKKHGGQMGIPGNIVEGKTYDLTMPIAIRKLPAALVKFGKGASKPIVDGEGREQSIETEHDVRKMLSQVGQCDHDTWIAIGLCLKDWGMITGYEGTAFELWHDWSEASKEGNYKGRLDCEREWTGMKVKGCPLLIPLHNRYREAITDQFYNCGWATAMLGTKRELWNVDTLQRFDRENFNITYNHINRREGDVAPELASGGLSKKRYTPYEILTKNNRLIALDGFTYDPTTEDRIVDWDNGKYINRFRRCGTLPMPEKMTPEGDKAWEFFINHMRFLTGDVGEAYTYFMVNWFAWQVQRPGVLLGFAPILIGGQGVGKSILGAFLGECLGEANVTKVSSSDLLGNFTDWSTKSAVGILEEFGNTATKQEKTMLFSKLKAVVTDKIIATRPMYQPPSTAKNHTNYIGFTNDRGLIRQLQEESDRRWKFFRTSSHSRQESFADPVGYADRLEEVFITLYPQFIYKKLMEWQIKDGFASIARRMEGTPAAIVDGGDSHMTEFEEMVKGVITKGKPGFYTKHAVGLTQLRMDLAGDMSVHRSFDDKNWAKGILPNVLNYMLLSKLATFDKWEYTGKVKREKLFVSSELFNYISRYCQGQGVSYDTAGIATYKHIVEAALNDPDYVVPGTKACSNGSKGKPMSMYQRFAEACLPDDMLVEPLIEPPAVKKPPVEEPPVVEEPKPTKKPRKAKPVIAPTAKDSDSRKIIRESRRNNINDEVDEEWQP